MTLNQRKYLRCIEGTARWNHQRNDGSILRGKIGKAFLNQENDSYLQIWTMNTLKPKNRGNIDRKKNLEIELRVSSYLQENFSFTVFEVTDKNERLRLEETIIATLHAEKTFVPVINE